MRSASSKVRVCCQYARRHLRGLKVSQLWVSEEAPGSEGTEGGIGASSDSGGEGDGARSPSPSEGLSFWLRFHAPLRVLYSRPSEDMNRVFPSSVVLFSILLIESHRLVSHHANHRSDKFLGREVHAPQPRRLSPMLRFPCLFYGTQHKPLRIYPRG